MGNKIKRFLSLALALLMIVGMMPTTFGVAANADEGTKTVYFQNNWLWTDVRAYTFDASADTTIGAEWPGTAMTLVGNDGTYDIYKAEIPANVTGLIFSGIKNDGSGTLDQSPNINEIESCTMWFMKWDNGNLVDTVMNHTPGAEATCCTGQTCTVCGITLNSATGEHTYEEGVCNAENPAEPEAPAVPYYSYDAETDTEDTNVAERIPMACRFVCQSGNNEEHKIFGTAFNLTYCTPDQEAVLGEDGVYTCRVTVDVEKLWEDIALVDGSIATNHEKPEFEGTYSVVYTWDAEQKLWTLSDEAAMVFPVACIEEEEPTYAAYIGEQGYETLADAFADAQNGDEVKILAAGEHALSTSGKNITITGAVDGVVFKMGASKPNLNGASITFNNITFNWDATTDYKGLQHSGELTYNNCVINGKVFLYGTSETFNNCTFNQTVVDYNVWTYGAKTVNFNGCTFNCAGKSVLIYSDQSGQTNDVTVTDCKFIASAPATGKAAIEIDSSLQSGIELTVDGKTTAQGFAEGSVSGNTLWNNKKGEKAEVIVDGFKVLKLDSDAAVTVPAAGIVVEKTETADEAAQVIVDEVTTSVQANTVLEADGFAASDIATGANGNVPTTDVNVSSEIKIETKSVGITNGELTKITFDVTPVLTYTDDQGNKETVEVKKFKEAITFRLPIPSNITSSYVIIEHEGENIGKYEVKEENDHQYVELKSAEFSEYAAIPAAATALANGCVTSNGRITVEAKNVNATSSVVLKLYSTAYGAEPIATTTLADKYFENGPAIHATLTASFMIKGESSSWNTTWVEGHPVAWAEPDRAELYIDDEKVAESIVTTNSADTVESEKIAWSEVDGVNPAPASIGKIGYKNLQAAVNAVKNGETINVNEELTENVTITQTSGVSLTVDGNGNTFNGKITIKARSSKDATDALTIKNFNFVTTKTEHEFIYSVENNHYPVNVTIKDCTFKGTGATSNVVAMNFKSANNLVIDGCTATKVHSLIQNTSGWKITIKNSEVKESGRGIALGTAQDVLVENVKIDALDTKYGIRMDAKIAGSSVTIKDCEISAFIPVVVRYAEAKGYDVIVDGTNNKMEPANTDNLWFAMGTSEYETNGTMPTDATGRLILTVKDENLNDEKGIYGHKYHTGNKYYTVKPEGTLGDGVVFESADGSYIGMDISGMVAYESVEIKLYAGETLLSTTVLNEAGIGKGYLNLNALTTNIEISKNASSWDSTWTTAPNATQTPTKAVLYIDGIEQNTATVRVNSQDSLDQTRAWADIDGVATIEVINGEESSWHITLADALAAAKNGATVKLYESVKAIAANGEVTEGKTVTITGKAKFDWNQGFLFVGRGTKEGDGKLIFDNAEIASVSNSTTYGINISAQKKNETKTNNGTVEMIDSTIEMDYMLNSNNLTLDNTKLLVKNGFRVSGRKATETPDGEIGTATMTIKNGSEVTVQNQNGMGVGYEGKGILNLENSTFTATQGFTVNADNGTFNVSGESTVNIKTLTGNTIDFLDGAIIKDSTIGGNVFVAGNVIFRGDNTFAMISDFGELTDYYGTTANMKWSVEPGSSVKLTNTGRYGLGYGDNVTITGELTDALTARQNLTEDDISFFTHGLVAQESMGWNKTSSFNVKDAYVVIGSNNSFGSKAGNYGGTYNFKFENTVLDASRITFYETPAKTTFELVDSDVVIGQFMTRDADSVFTLTNTKLVSTSNINGNDEGQYHAGKLVLNGSELTYSAALTLENDGTIVMDSDSVLTAPSISDTGTITIDAAKVAASAAGTTVQVVKGDASAITADQVVLTNGVGVSVTIDATGVTLTRKNTVAANGNDDYATVQEAIYAAAANSTDKTVKLLCDVTENTTIIVNKNVTLDLNGFDLNAAYVAVFSGSHIVDSSTEKGLLKVAEGNVMLQANNAQMPIWNETDGYVFAAANLDYERMYTNVPNLVFSSSFKPSFGKFGANGDYITKLFADTDAASDNGLRIIIRLTWMNGDNLVKQDFEYADVFVQDVYAATSKVFTLGITSLASGADVNVQVVVTSNTGAEAISKGLVYKAN